MASTAAKATLNIVSAAGIQSGSRLARLFALGIVPGQEAVAGCMLMFANTNQRHDVREGTASHVPHPRRVGRRRQASSLLPRRWCLPFRTVFHPYPPINRLRCAHMAIDAGHGKSHGAHHQCVTTVLNNHLKHFFFSCWPLNDKNVPRIEIHQ
jgi:hypothetical protein